MSTEKKIPENTFSPQYFIINKSEPQYDLLKNQLLDSSHLPVGSSYYFIRAANEKGCICRIKDGNGPVLFYEILNHLREGIASEDIQDAIRDPSNASPLPGYFYLTPTIEQKLRALKMRDASCLTKRCKPGTLA